MATTLRISGAFAALLLTAAPAAALSSFAAYDVTSSASFSLNFAPGAAGLVFDDTGFYFEDQLGTGDGATSFLGDLDASEGAASVGLSAQGTAEAPNGLFYRYPFRDTGFLVSNNTGTSLTVEVNWSLAVDAAASTVDTPSSYEFAGAYGYSEIAIEWGAGNQFVENAQAGRSAGFSPFYCRDCLSGLAPSVMFTGVESIDLDPGQSLQITLYTEIEGVADVAPIPVPAAGGLLAAAFAGLGGLALRRRRRG